jgi:hypothetical protein
LGDSPGAVDAPSGNCWISRHSLGLGLRLDEGNFHERGLARRTSSRAIRLGAAIRPAADIVTIK